MFESDHVWCSEAQEAKKKKRLELFAHTIVTAERGMREHHSYTGTGEHFRSRSVKLHRKCRFPFRVPRSVISGTSVTMAQTQKSALELLICC